jgi:hypothetical protein
MQRTYSRADGALWLEDVLRAQGEEITELQRWLGPEALAEARAAWERRDYQRAAELIDTARQRGKSVMGEVENLLPSFRAEIAAAIAKHRTVVGSRAVDAFAEKITALVIRYGSKIQGLRQQGHNVAAVEAAIKAEADAAVRRAFQNGRVEFTTPED